VLDSLRAYVKVAYCCDLSFVGILTNVKLLETFCDSAFASVSE
jgi:hypothetical protein